MVAVFGIAHHERTPVTISRGIKLIKLDADALRVLAWTATTLKKLKSTMVSSVVLTA
jgi:hypothetical protein